MAKYALIRTGIVREIMTRDAAPGGLSSGTTAVDVTSVSPAPEAGWTYDGQDFAAPAAPTTAEKWEAIRLKRNMLLGAADCTQLADYPASAQLVADWAAYRQLLRDIPETYAADPDTVIWPTPPA